MWRELGSNSWRLGHRADAFPLYNTCRLKRCSSRPFQKFKHIQEPWKYKKKCKHFQEFQGPLWTLFHHPIGTGEAIYKTFSFHAIQIWTHMPVSIKIGTSAAQFKKKSLEYLKYHDISYRTSHWLVCMCLYSM